MATKGNGGRFNEWMANGFIATIGWFVVLATYCTFRGFGIEDPILGQAFLLLTGAWVAALTLAQNRKNVRVEQKVERLERVALEQHPESTGELDE